MFVGVSRLELHIPAARSLKDKRGIVQSLTTRIRNQFPVSVAEIEALDDWNLAVLGMAVVSNNGGHARDVIDRVVAYLDRARMDADPGEVAVEVLSAL
ncbi:MAG TPA: DUF503 domain-containing protein [Chloroflexota bacterium]|nr:DUF503 domain-containing protein [Chloroflexota bacterium]